MTSAYPTTFPTGGTPSPSAYVAMKQALNTGQSPPQVLTGYALDDELGYPVLLATLIGDTFPKQVTPSTLVNARLLFSELMEMSYLDAMEMPNVVANGPVRACFAERENDSWNQVKAEIMAALANRYREGMDGRHTGATQ